MNGISSNLRDEIKKSGERKHKEKFKFIAAILVTNVMVAILCLPMGESKPPSQSKNAPNIKSLHTGHQMMTLPLTVLISTEDKSSLETPVTLVSKDKKIIVQKAWLHEVVKVDGDISQFKIEINNEDVVHISEFVNDGMVAVPYVQKKIKLQQTRGSKYEVAI